MGEGVSCGGNNPSWRPVGRLVVVEVIRGMLGICAAADNSMAVRTARVSRSAVDIVDFEYS